MAAIVSVVSGGTVLETQRFEGAASDKPARINAVNGARYVLAETQGGVAASRVAAKRVGKNLVLEQDSEEAGRSTLIIEDFFISDAQLVGVGADGEYLQYLAATDEGAVQAGAMGDGASALLSLAPSQPAAVANAFQFSEGASSLSSSALAGLAAIAGGVAMSSSQNSGGKAPPAVVASGFAFDAQPSATNIGEPVPMADDEVYAADAPALSETAATESAAQADNDNAEHSEEIAEIDAAVIAGSEAIDQLEAAVDHVSSAVVTGNQVPEASVINADSENGAPAAVVPFAVDDIPVIEKVMDDHGVIQGFIENGGYTDDVYPTLMGHADPGVKVHVYRGKFLQGYTVADENGVWSYTPSSAYASGTHSMTVKYEYPNKDTSGYSEPYIITIDKIAPGIPQITGILDDEGRITGAITDQTITDDNRPTITGTAEANAKLIVYDKGKQIGSTTVGADGKWSFTPDTPLADGLHMLSYSAVDRAGNNGEQSEINEFFVDTRPEKINIYYAEDDVGSVTDEVFSGGVTDDSTPTLFGTATAGGIVKIYEGNVLLGQVIADVDGTWQFTPPAALSEGAHTFHATVTLPAKGESERSKPFKLEVDFTAPARPSIELVHDDVGPLQGNIGNGKTTDDARPTLLGKAEAGSTVIIYDNGNLLGTAVADVGGNWSFTPATPLLDQTHSFTVKAEDKAGNLSGASEPFAIVVDTLPPAAPVIVTVNDNYGSKTGLLKSGDITDDNTPTLSGTAEPKGTVIIKDNGLEIGRAPVGANGKWTFEPAQPLADGAHSLTVQAVDEVGNVSVPSAPFNLEVDRVPPVRPTIETVLDDSGNNAGPVANGGTSDDPTPTLQGKGVAGTTVYVYDGLKLLGNVVVKANGEWVLPVSIPLADGKHRFTAVADDVAGNRSETSDAYVVTIDTTPLTTPSIESAYDDFGSVTGSVLNGGILDDKNPGLYGKAGAGTTVVIYQDGSELARVKADASGNWELKAGAVLNKGWNTFTVQSINAAGSVSKMSNEFNLGLDNSGYVDWEDKQITPKVGGLSQISSNGLSVKGDYLGIVAGAGMQGVGEKTLAVYGGRATTFTFDEGPVERLDFVIRAVNGTMVLNFYSVHGVLLETKAYKTVAGDNYDFDVSYSGSVPLAYFKADLTNENAGVAFDNISWGLAPKVVPKSQVDAVDLSLAEYMGEPAPMAGDAVSAADAAAVSEVAAPESVTQADNDNAEHIAEIAEIDAAVIAENEVIDQPEAAIDNFPSAAITGSQVPGASVIKADGDSDAYRGVGIYAFEETPVIEKVMDDHGVIQGVIENGGYTDDVYPTLMGHADPGVKVHVYRGKFLQGYVVADENGEWSYTPSSAYASGTHSMTVKYEYPNKDTSGYSEPYIITIDKIAPGIPKITGILDDEGRITGAITDQAITDDNRPTITGTAEANVKLIVYDKGKQIGSTTVGADGKWSFTPDTPLVDGLHMLSYSAVDRAGNSGEQSEVNEFFVDTRPEKINIYYAEDDVGSVTDEVFSGGVTDDSTPTLFGTATAGGIVKIYEGNVLLGQVTADVDGTWQFTPPAALSEGAHTFHATVTLPAKGESERSKPFKLEVDFTAPAEPAIDQVMDDAGAIQGVVERGQTTDDATPTLSGKAEKGSTVRIFSNGNLLGSALADANGEWLFTPAKPLADGAHTFTITASDAAGNQAASAVPYEIHIDTLRPEAPTIVSVEDDVGQVQGFLQKGDTTDDTQPTFKGTAEANSTVIVRDNGIEIGRVQANGGGEWSFTPALALSGGAHGITVVALDKAGNISVPSDSFDFSVIVVPAEPAAAPTIDSIYDDVGLAKGLLASGAVTDDSMPLVSGKGVPNTTVILKDNGVEVGRSLVDAAGDWAFLPSAPLSFGLHNLVATTVDIARNLGRSSGVFGFRVVELGRAGALENFNTLTYDQVSTGNGEAVVLPTGVKLSGTFYGSTEYDGSNASRPGDPRPEDGLFGLGLSSGKTVRIELPSESSIISYHIALRAGPAVVNYFDVDGKNIGSRTYPANTAGFHREVFEAPAGSMVASIQVKSALQSPVTIEALQWGERYITGVTIAETSADHLGGRFIYGMVTGVAHLKSNEVVQVSTDGGKTWTNASFSEGSWAATQKDMPPGNWVAEVRVVDKNSGLSFGVSDTKVVEVVGAGAPRIVRIEEAEGMYTAAKAADGTVMEVSLDSTGAKVGDILHIRWGVTTYDHVLTKANIDSGHASIKIPSEQTNWQGVYKDFSVTAQIIGGGGAIGTLSDSYKVVGTYAVSAAIKDVLQTTPQDNAYIGTGFKITTEGVMKKTALTESSYAGLTLSGASETTALFTLDKPAREISVRLSGLDSPLGAKIQIFDVQGSLIEEQLVYGDATVFHAKLFSYVSKDERVDIGSFKIVAQDSSVTLDGFTRKEVTHTADARNPNLLDSSMESFYGTGGDDIVTITMRPDSYFAGVTAGIHGGDGVDTLIVANQTEVGLLELGDRVSSMEIIELNSSTGWHAQQSVFVTVSDVLRNGATDAFYVGDKSRVQMMIKDYGSVASSILLSDYLYSGMNLNDRGSNTGDIGDWVKKSSVAIGGVVYDSYQHSGINVEVLVFPKSSIYITNRAEYIEPWKEIYYKAASASSSELYSELSLLQAAHTDFFAPESNALQHSGFAGSNFGPAASSVQSFGLDPLDSHYALNAY